MKKGFTLIELLAVIIILAVISLIAVPVVIDVINDAKDSANTSTAYGILDSAKLYLTESSFDETKRAEITNLDNLYDKVTFSGTKPIGGRLYINSNGLTAMSLVIDNKCYKKEFTGKLEVSDGDTCDLGYVGNDSISPTVSFSLVGNPLNSNGWAKEDFYVSISVIDSDSGGYSYDWCSGTSNCTPTTTVEKSTNATLISLESSNNIICVIGKDAAGNVSETTCSEAYKLDKTNPTTGTINLVGTMGSNDWYTSNVTINKTDGTDSLSGLSSSLLDVTDITSNTTGTLVTLTTTDLAGNSSATNMTIKVDKNSPTITENSGTVTITVGDSNLVSSYFTTAYGISGGNVVCTPVNTNSLSVGTPTLSCTATGLNGLTASANKQITINAVVKTLTNAIRGLGNINVSMSTLTVPGHTSLDYEAELAMTADDYGTSFYYRGNIQNNYISFANKCWRIVRITGNDAVKIVLYNKNSSSCSSTGSDYAFAGQSPYNTNNYNQPYVGYMYGNLRNVAGTDEIVNISTSYYFSNSYYYDIDQGRFIMEGNKSTGTWSYYVASNYQYTCLNTTSYGGCNKIYQIKSYESSTTAYATPITYYGDTYAEAHANDVKSTIMTYLENWYVNNLSGYSSYLADTIWCNDKSGSTSGGRNTTWFSGYYRIDMGVSYPQYSPSLVCPNDTDGGNLSKFNVSGTIGNGKSQYPIGLLTADEVAYAGNQYTSADSTSYYLYENASWVPWWTLTPYSFLNYYANIITVTGIASEAGSGQMYNSRTDYNNGVRPAISLLSTTKVTGSGTKYDPYVVQP